jgi:hypothetical protein
MHARCPALPFPGRASPGEGGRPSAGRTLPACRRPGAPGQPASGGGPPLAPAGPAPAPHTCAPAPPAPQLGAMYSPQLRCFVAGGVADGKAEGGARRGALPDLKQWSSVEELRQLVQVGAGDAGAGAAGPGRGGVRLRWLPGARGCCRGGCSRRGRASCWRGGAPPRAPARRPCCPNPPQVFGPYAAAAIAERLLGCIRDCLDSLDKVLEVHQGELDSVMDAYEAKGSCLEEGARRGAAGQGWRLTAGRWPLHAARCTLAVRQGVFPHGAAQVAAVLTRGCPLPPPPPCSARRQRQAVRRRGGQHAAHLAPALPLPGAARAAGRGGRRGAAAGGALAGGGGGEHGDHGWGAAAGPALPCCLSCPPSPTRLP